MEEFVGRVSLIRLAITVEGETERQFVNLLLAERLGSMGIGTMAILFQRTGGGVTVTRLISEIVRLVPSFDAVTSLVDYYGLGGKKGRSVKQIETFVRDEVARKVRPRASVSVYPYVQKHEFEGILFSDLDAFSKAVRISKRQHGQLKQIRSQFLTPEEINDGKKSAPSKRILRVIPDYDKVLDGPKIALQTGIDCICKKCPHFRGWIAYLDSLANPCSS